MNDNPRSILTPNQNRTPTIVSQNNASKVPRPEDIDLRNKLLPTIGGTTDQNSSTPQSRSFRPALNADDPASLRGEKETKIPKKEALHSLQLMEQVRLLRNILSYHQKSERSGGGNPNCPICFGEDGMSDVSSLNTGLGDGNFNQLVYSSLSPMQPCLHRNMKRSHCSQDSVCFYRDCCMSWTETQLISSCCHTSQCISSDEMATEISEEFLTTESEDSDFKVMREVGYLESFLDVRLLPKEYKLHLRTDLSISLVIVFLFVCVQFFFLQNFLLL